jgi:hypothetical protein
VAPSSLQPARPADGGEEGERRRKNAVSKFNPVETAPIPKRVLRADLYVLIRNAAADQSSGTELADKTLDVFANKPDQ